MLTEKDPELWEIAKRRASFKYHLAVYIVMNIFFWVVWYFSRDYSGDAHMWPIWPTLGWGIGLAFHFMGAYVFPKNNSVEREYEKLIKSKQ
jgi:hypothetical protein